MHNMLLSVQVLSVCILMYLCIYVFSKWNTKLQGYLFFHCVVSLVNNAGYLMCMLSGTKESYLLSLKMSYLGRVWVPFSLLLLVLSICKKVVEKKYLFLLATIHMITYFMVLTAEYHTLYYATLEFKTDGVFCYLSHESGIWYKVHSLLLFGYIIYGLYSLIKMSLITKNPVSRKRFICVTLGVICSSLFFALELLNLEESYDLTMVGYTLSMIVWCVAIHKYKLIDTLQLAKDYCLEEYAEGVIIVDENYKIDYKNAPAASIFPELEQDSEAVIRMLDCMIERGETIEKKDSIYKPRKQNLSNSGEDCVTLYTLINATESFRYMEDLKEQKEIAEAANASKSAFLSVVSHEIRTPMNAIVGMTEILLREKESLNQKQKEYLQNIYSSGKALVMIINDILDQSKMEAGKMQLVEEPYELRAILSDIRMIIENRIGLKPIRLEYEIDETIPRELVGDGLRIRQILINLMNNAVKFTEEGYIRLSIEMVPQEREERVEGEAVQTQLTLKFTVADSGQGIRPEDLERLGEAFGQVDVKRNHKKEGTGLGLSISKDFIAMMGGQLEVTSEYEKGSQFFFTITQGRREAEETGTDPGESLEFTAPDARILIVDDTELNLLIAEDLLEPLGMTIDTADSGRKALTAVENYTYDAILVDYMMPEMDGVETTKRIRSMGNQAVPIIALTGDTSEETKERFLQAGISDLTEKPIDLQKLKVILRKILPKEKIIQI